MGDFDEFAAEQGGAFQAREREFHDKQQRERAAWDAKMAAAQTYLEAEVMPIVDEARAAFERQGLQVNIKRNWDNGLFTNPAIEFSVSGQKRRPHDTSTYEVTGEKATIRHDGDELTASIRRRNDRGTHEFDKGHDLDAVRRVLKAALQSLYDELTPKD